MYIKNKRDSSSIKVCSPFELYCKLKVLYFGIAYFSYTYRYQQAKKTEDNEKFNTNGEKGIAITQK